MLVCLDVINEWACVLQRKQRLTFYALVSKWVEGRETVKELLIKFCSGRNVIYGLLRFSKWCKICFVDLRGTCKKIKFCQLCEVKCFYCTAFLYSVITYIARLALGQNSRQYLLIDFKVVFSPIQAGLSMAYFKGFYKLEVNILPSIQHNISLFLYLIPPFLSNGSCTRLWRN
jgi:hypothetical protein